MGPLRVMVFERRKGGHQGEFDPDWLAPVVADGVAPTTVTVAMKTAPSRQGLDPPRRLIFGRKDAQGAATSGCKHPDDSGIEEKHLVSEEADSETPISGGSGIRTHGDRSPTAFQEPRIRPLCHPSRAPAVAGDERGPRVPDAPVDPNGRAGRPGRAWPAIDGPSPAGDANLSGTTEEVAPAMNDPAAVVRGGGQPQPLSRDIVSVLGEMVAMAVVDLEGALSYVSERWCALSGWSADEVLGSHWAQIVHQDDLPAARRPGREAVERGEAISYESRIVSRDKAKVTWIQSTVTPLLDAAGVRTGWLLVAHDLNDHKMAAEALAQSERRLQVIFDSSSDVITILEPDGTRRATSASAQQLFGYPAGWIPEKAPWNVIHPDDLADAQRALHEFVAKRPTPLASPTSSGSSPRRGR